jgi:hypothetical protein
LRAGVDRGAGQHRKNFLAARGMTVLAADRGRKL